MNQELALELLASAGMEAVLATNGQEALDVLARDTDFDGVLMDIQMPVMDGYTATRAIRSNPAFKDLPIIALTATALAGETEQWLQAGLWDHIAKPLNVGTMFATLARWIHPVARARSPGTPAPPPPERAPPAASGTSSPPPEWLDALDEAGIHTRTGLATAVNNPALYQRLLLRFRDGQRDFARLFAAAQAEVQAGTDLQAAERCAHTLRGTAATIGAQRLRDAADRLEKACRQQAAPAQTDALLRGVMEELAPVTAALTETADVTTPHGDAG